MTVAGTTLHYEAKGNGHRIALVRAGFLHRMWDEQFKLLVKGFKVIGFDVGGLGKSDTPTLKYSDIGDLHTLPTSLKVERMHVVAVVV